ncbi:phosphopyruvate hydratase, putative [Babesia ovis]|uniref:Phosphopyruvate hydratase, putative n=1 Tax=Babesia ovis TaxID=5869 RepID=A0A9W5T9L6_BABOV|nr:phosphopyruvate hydratase, putative [Babesia ovis]
MQKTHLLATSAESSTGGIASLLLQGGLNTLGVCDQQVITHNLYLGTDLGSEHLVGLPVILVEWVLNGDNGVLVAEVLVVGNHLGSSLHVWRLTLEAQVVRTTFLNVELRGSNVHTNLDLAFETGLLDGLNQQVKGLLSRLDVGGKTTFITDIGGILTVLGVDDLLEVVVDFTTHADGFLEGGSTNGKDHEFLHGQAVASVGATVDNVETWYRKYVLVSAFTSQLSKVLVERLLLVCSGSTGSSHRHNQNGVGTELRLAVSPLVYATIEILDHKVIQTPLPCGIVTFDTIGNGGVDISNSLQHTLSQVARFVTVTELKSLVNTGGGTRGASGPEDTGIGGEVHFDSGIPTGVC